MDTQEALEAILVEVRKVNQRLDFLEGVIEEVILKGLPQVELTEEEIQEIKASVEEMRKGNYVTLEALKRD
ncbi:MAG: hypothetical protein NWE89_06175 [Candidatus Bathyarchaeota archaeon]|nr:hypothetical protein [Candidatus Bathyarchaeota archaeon]